jgi:multidrug efflux system outer membrane protein
MKKTIYILPLAALLSGCSLYSNYQRTGTEAAFMAHPDTLVGAVPVSVGDSVPQWRDFFTDPNLQSLIQKGLDQNLDLKSAHLKVTEAEASLRAAKLAFFPSLALSPSGTVSSFDGNTPTKIYNLPVAAQWQIDAFGGLRNARKASAMQLEQTKSYRQAVQLQLIAAIANYYYTLQMLDSQLAIAQETEKSWGEYVVTLRALMDAGGANAASVAQAEANHFTVRATVADIKQQILTAENAFCTLLGQPVGSQVITRSGSEVKPAVLSPIPVSSLATRPDVKEAEQSLATAFYVTNEARAAFYPNITLSGSAGWTNSSGMGIVNPGKLLWSAVASLTQPLFQNGKLRAQLAIRKAQQEEASLAFQQTLLSAGEEVNNALAQWQTAHDKTTLYKGQVEAATRALTSTKLLMENSSTNYLTVITAQQTLFSSQLAAVANDYQETAAAISLYQALGGGSR